MPATKQTAGVILKRRVNKDLRDNGLVLDPKEVSLLDYAARVADIIEQLDAIVDRDGVTTTTADTGMVHANPALSESRQHRALFARLMSQINLTVPTPKDRQKQENGKRGAASRWGA